MTEEDAKETYIEMIEMMATDDGPQKVTNLIMRLGRTDMSVLCTYIFVRGLNAELTLNTLKETG